MSLTLQDISSLLNSRATTWYGQEAVSQLEHALQCAQLAENANETPETIVAALLHDLGHILIKENPDAFTDEAKPPLKDDLHQYVALPFLRGVFSDAVLEPIKLHVEAKRYLCATAPGYLETLSEPSKISLEFQGGVMNQKEVADFEKNEFYKEAVNLRRWDDLAKDPYLISPTLDSFINAIETSLK